MNELNGISQVKKGLNHGEIAGLILGGILFITSMYAMRLAIKAHKLTIRKLNDEGYK